VTFASGGFFSVPPPSSLGQQSWHGFQNIEWYFGHIEIYLLPLAPLLAVGFKGLSRLQVFTAGILVWVLTASFVYS
jgi:hypothetical protein